MLFKKTSSYIGMMCISLLSSSCGLNETEEEPTALVPTVESREEPVDVQDDEPSESASQDAGDATSEAVTEDTALAAESQYDGDIVVMNHSENEFVSVVASEFKYSDFGSFVVDLDRDGLEEAFVFDGFDDSSQRETDTAKYFQAFSVWYVDEELNASVVKELQNAEICCEQSVVTCDGRDYMTFNGYMGVESIGIIYTVMYDELTNAVSEGWPKGMKFFSGDEVIWMVEPGNSGVFREAGTAVKDGTPFGYAAQPYHLYYKDGYFHLYGAKKVTKEEAAGVTGLELKEPEGAVSVEYILRENNELDENYVVVDEVSYLFYSNIYIFADDSETWEFKETVNGYFFADIREGSNWDVLSEIME